MVIPDGYKKTEVGIIPVDWDCEQIKSFAKVCMCKRIFAYQTSMFGDIPFYKIGTFGEKPDAYISRKLFLEYKEKYSYPEKGDILFSAAGTLGRTLVFDGKDSYFQDSNIVWLKIDKTRLINEYLQYYYQIIVWTPSEGSTISRLYNGIIESTRVAFPLKDEQKAIVTVLSDVDSLIDNLEKLISKKKNIKQGAMQELLTGKRRLPGFTEEWKKYSLGDVLIVRHGQSQHGIENPAGKYPILATGGIIGRTNQFLCCTPSVLIGRKGTINKPQFMDTPFWTIDTLFYTTIKSGIDAKYIYYIFCTIPWIDFNEASGIPSLSAKVIERVKITLPSHKEQVAIQTILTDMDNEIDELEKKLVKYRNIKKGMMSELLTGHIRLTEKEDA